MIGARRSQFPAAGHPIQRHAAVMTTNQNLPPRPAKAKNKKAVNQSRKALQHQSL
jgi:hypothetical protein